MHKEEFWSRIYPKPRKAKYPLKAAKKLELRTTEFDYSNH